MANFKDLISQAQKMQEKMKETQEEIKKIEMNLKNFFLSFARTN